MTKVLELENISKEFGGKTVVDRLSCEVRAGEVLGMLGHNGAGKTTTIRCVLGIIRPDSGRILFQIQRGAVVIAPGAGRLSAGRKGPL